MARLVGRGIDPHGRYPLGVVFDVARDSAAYVEMLTNEWATETAMSKQAGGGEVPRIV